MRLRFTARLCGVLLSGLLAGCGTTKMTNSPRAASEMLLISQAVDYSVAKLDFTALAGQRVFLETVALDGTVDKGYLISSVRQQLLAHGALLQEKRESAVYVVELRAGAVGTDQHSVMVGTPAISLPPVVPGLPPVTSIPEIALAKKSDQRGVAKIGVFAYNRITGRAVWQSGAVESESTLKDTWVFGAGPFRRGSIRKRAELAGEPLPDLPTPAELLGRKAAPEQALAPTTEQYFPNDAVAAPPLPVPAAAAGITGVPILAEKELVR
jgi:hypothetical protein